MCSCEASLTGILSPVCNNQPKASVSLTVTAAWQAVQSVQRCVSHQALLAWHGLTRAAAG